MTTTAKTECFVKVSYERNDQKKCIVLPYRSSSERKQARERLSTKDHVNVNGESFKIAKVSFVLK